MTAEPGGGHADGFRGSSVVRLRGAAFRVLCFLATLFGVSVVSLLFLYVAVDAFRPFSADPGWHATFAGTLLLPAILLAAYYVLFDRAGGRVAYTSLGVPAVGTLGGAGLLIFFWEIITPRQWLALAVAIGVAAGVVVAHQQYRPRAALERLGVLLVAPALSAFGVPPVSVDYTLSTPLTGTDLLTIAFSTPALAPSVREVVMGVPWVPPDWSILVVTVGLPLGYLFGRVVAGRRGDGQGVRATVAGAALVGFASVAAAVGFGFPPDAAVLLATGVTVPTAVYLEGVIRRRKGLAGLLFPVVMIGGAWAGVAITGMLGIAGPDPWLDWGFLTSPTSWQPAEAGIYPALVGSVLIVLVIALTAFPVGVGAAIYLEEYAPNDGRFGRVVDLIEINIGNLAGVPSVVYGLLGLALFVQGIGLRSGIVLVGGLTVGLLILPIVIISAQEAIRAVPDSFRRGSYAMGASRWQTVRRVVLPEALPGILTGTILALGRAIGETAPLLMIGIAASVRATPSGIFEKTGAMPRQIFSWSSEIEPEFRFGVLAAGVITLLGVLLLMNGTAIVLRNRYQRES